MRERNKSILVRILVNFDLKCCVPECSRKIASRTMQILNSRMECNVKCSEYVVGI